MRIFIFLFVAFFALRCFAVPRPNVEYTYEVVRGNGGDVIRHPDNALIPHDPTNADYQAYRRWLNDGHKAKIIHPVDPNKSRFNLILGEEN